MANGDSKLTFGPDAIDEGINILGNMDPGDFQRAMRGTLSPSGSVAPTIAPTSSGPGLGPQVLGRLPAMTTTAAPSPMGYPDLSRQAVSPDTLNVPRGTLSRIGSVLGHIGTGAAIFADPKLADQIPGTRQFAEREQARQAALGSTEAETGLKKAQAEDAASRGAYQSAQAAHEALLNQEEPQRFATSQEDVESQAQQRREQGEAAIKRAAATSQKTQEAAAAQGFKTSVDADGNLVLTPMAPDELPAPLQAKLADQKNLAAYRQAQTELANARADLAKAQNDPNSPQFQLLKQRADTAQANVGRAEAMLMNSFANTRGTTPQGQPLPGAPLDLAGNPVGLSTYRETGPTGQQRTRGQFARDMIQFIDTQYMPAIDQAQKSGELGPVEGRIEQLKTQLGNADPGFIDFAMNSELLKGGSTSVHFGAKGAVMGFQDKIGALLSPKLTPEALRESGIKLRDLMEIYARSGGRSVTQPALPGEPGASPNASSGVQLGQSVKIKGKNMTVTKVNKDGTFEAK